MSLETVLLIFPHEIFLSYTVFLELRLSMIGEGETPVLQFQTFPESQMRRDPFG